MRERARINEEIRVREVRLTGANGEALGIVSMEEARRLASEQNLDLVEIAPGARPPVCKLMNYGKYRYEQQKREKETKRKQKTIVMKEVKIRPGIEKHDLETKMRAISGFLKEGAKVRVTVMFRGREATHPELGEELLKKISEGIECVVERGAKLEGKNMLMIISGKKGKAVGKGKEKDAPGGGEEIQRDGERRVQEV